MAIRETASLPRWMERWAQLVVRLRWFWVIAWPVFAVSVFLPAPRIPTLLRDDRSGFLPADMPSQRGLALLSKEFPDRAYACRVVVVAARDGGLVASDRAYLSRVAALLAGRSDELNWRVRAVSSSPLLRPFLESADGTASLIVVELPAANLTHHSVRRARLVLETLAGQTPPRGLRVEVTGDAALGELLDRTAKRDVDMMSVWAFFAVAMILLLVYRSGVAMLLPLASISTALMLSLGLTGWAATSWLPVTGLVEMFIIVILVGSGVDHCLFLFARYREEMALRVNSGSLTGGGLMEASRASVVAAIAHTGPAILAGAGTNVVGLATLILARNRDLYTSGPTIACSLVLATVAVLTLVPALMSLLRPRWLVSARPDREEGVAGPLWQGVARLATQFPGSVTALLTATLAVPALAAGGTYPLYDHLAEYPGGSSFVQGALLYRNHFQGGRSVADLTLIVSSATGATLSPDGDGLRRALDGLREDLSEGVGLYDFRGPNDPLGRRSGAARVAPGFPGDLAREVVSKLGRTFYVGGSQRALRVDLGLAAAARSTEALDLVPKAREIARTSLSKFGLFDPASPSGLIVDVAGETAYYHDLRALRARDFRVIAVASILLISVILVWLTRSGPESAILLGATLLTYFATYGVTWLIFRVCCGVEGLAWQLDFLLFIIILSLGQDYNIFVVTRIHEELRDNPPDLAIGRAIRKTGRVVSSCGLVMAATFASMFAGSLLMLKEFSVALALGILIDTFVVRPLLVPSAILLLYRVRPPGERSAEAAGGCYVESTSH